MEHLKALPSRMTGTPTPEQAEAELAARAGMLARQPTADVTLDVAKVIYEVTLGLTDDACARFALPTDPAHCRVRVQARLAHKHARNLLLRVATREGLKVGFARDGTVAVFLPRHDDIILYN